MSQADHCSNEKIVFVNRFFYPDHSATSQMLSDLAFDLAKAGRTVEVITSRLRYDDTAAQLPSFEVIEGVRVHRVWTSRFGRGGLVRRSLDYLTFYATAAHKLWQRTDASTTVVAKTDPPLFSIVAAPIARLRGAKLINWLQDLFPEVAAALGVKFICWPILNVLRSLRNWTLRSAHMNVVIGELMKERLVSQGISLEQIRVIPNWADGELINPVSREDNALHKAWGFENKFVIGYSGNLGLAHEFSTILDAAEALKEREDIVFLFIGGGAQLSAVKQEVMDRGLTSVVFKPYQPRDNLSESLSAADVHLISLNPALEGLIVPSKFYGIAAAGRPSIFLGDCEGEISRVLQECTCGYSISSDDLACLIAKTLEFVRNPCQTGRLANNARIKFHEKYDRKIAVRAFIQEFYAEKLPDSKRGVDVSVLLK
ncbi:glycosyltransferase family 4 protein [bacterium]|nr:glycosyltransferase family 4 protein [bacterium]